MRNYARQIFNSLPHPFAAESVPLLNKAFCLLYDQSGEGAFPRFSEMVMKKGMDLLHKKTWNDFFLLHERLLVE